MLESSDVSRFCNVSRLCYDVTPHPQVVKQISVRLAKPHPLGRVNWTRIQKRARQVGAGVTWLQKDRLEKQTGQTDRMTGQTV